MFKTSIYFLILLINLLHYISSDQFDSFRTQWLSSAMREISTGSCSEHFQYRIVGDFIIGKLTVPHMEIGDTVKLQFMDGASPASPYSLGILLPNGSSQDVINRLQKKQQLSFRVDFPVMLDVPQLYKIFINDNELCKIDEGITKRIYTLQHTLNIINGSVQVYTYNINMPHFAEARKESCGLVDREILIYGATPLVYGGQLIIRGEYPWLTAIYEKHSRGISFICGGSLVTSKIILSAAHCFEIRTAEKITTMLGRYNLTNSMEDGCTTRDIERIILHPDYKSGPSFADADLALLVMKEHVSFTKFVKPICLWSESADEWRIVNQTGVVVGWGRNEDGNTLSVAPKKVSTKIVTGEVCLRSSVAFSAITSSRTLCAGKRDGSGPCEGDSGSGLVLNRNGIWMVRGVVSLGLTDKGRCNLQEYTVYCDVAKHMAWLQNHIKQQETAVTGPLADICGRASTESRITHPWLAAIYLKLLTGEVFSCTGTIVSSRSVLIPASCFIRKTSIRLIRSTLKVYFGRYDLGNIDEKGVVPREVEATIHYSEHKPYDDLDQDNNIALLQMKDPIGFTQYIKPICLWSEPRDQSQILGQPVTITGWIIADVRKGLSTVPKSMEVNIASLEQCQLLGHNVSTTSNILCIPRDGNLTGRILMIERNGRWLLLGICRFFRHSDNFCAIVYTDIAKKMSWIQKNMFYI